MKNCADRWSGLLGFEKRGDRFIEQRALEMAANMIAHETPESLVGQQIGSYQMLSLLGLPQDDAAGALDKSCLLADSRFQPGRSLWTWRMKGV